MSKRINVNPGQYKVAGRERQGEHIPEPERSSSKQAFYAQRRWNRKKAAKKTGRTEPDRPWTGSRQASTRSMRCTPSRASARSSR